VWGRPWLTHTTKTAKIKRYGIPLRQHSLHTVVCTYVCMYNEKIKVTLSHKTAAGILYKNYKLNSHDLQMTQSVLTALWCREQGCLQIPAEQRQRWSSPDRQWQGIPGACSCHREGTVTECDASRWRHNQCRRRSRPESSKLLNIVGLAERLSKIRRRCTTETAVYENTQPKLDSLRAAASQVHGWVHRVVCSYLLAENTKRAAAFMTDCSRCSSMPEIPASTELQ